MIPEASNLSNAEFFRLNGALTPERVEALLEVEATEFDEARDVKLAKALSQ
jgi:hypothetical protein